MCPSFNTRETVTLHEMCYAASQRKQMAITVVSLQLTALVHPLFMKCGISR
uniref:Uncharacterized protein n=1 Tax=Arundo donax TaxID=35708 RepID=A0A0A9E7Y9_ARUDO